MEKDYTALVIGQNFPLADCRGKEGFVMEYNENKALFLIAALPKVTPAEIEALTVGDARLGLFMYDNMIYLPCKFNQLEGDATYNIHAYKNPEKIFVDNPKDGEGILLTVFVVDSLTNTLVGMRTAGMSTRWTRTLKNMIEEQKKNPISTEEWYSKIDTAHKRWTPKEMLRNSSVVYKLGSR